MLGFAGLVRSRIKTVYQFPARCVQAIWLSQILPCLHRRVCKRVCSKRHRDQELHACPRHDGLAATIIVMIVSWWSKLKFQLTVLGMGLLCEKYNIRCNTKGFAGARHSFINICITFGWHISKDFLSHYGEFRQLVTLRNFYFMDAFFLFLDLTLFQVFLFPLKTWQCSSTVRYTLWGL